jgi:hypothetical protein
LDERLVKTLARAWRWPKLMDGDVYTSITGDGAGHRGVFDGQPLYGAARPAA